MQARRKAFRIETMTQGGRTAAARGEAASGQGERILTEIKALRALIQPQQGVSQQMIDAYKAQMAEAQKLKSELDLIYEAINKTKREIATLHVTGFEGPEMARVTDELDAVVAGTERATEQILAAAEDIDQMASTLAARLKDEQDVSLVQDAQDRVVKIFEACNFQDLTGQRIGKVVATLKFIETHIVRMMEIWGGIDSFKDIAPEAMAVRDGDAKLLNGPKLDGEAGHVSQNDIDALFN
jgi:chemotaxis protein CheZ